jgi:hemoglobin-like flavoprotein
MKDHSYELVASFERCNRDRTFIDTFYKCFLSKGPEFAEMFAHTDFKHQKLMLRQSLLELISFEVGMSGTEADVDRLGQRHKGLGVTPAMYSMWLDALCEAIQQHDPEYTPELEQFWRNAMQIPIKKMIAIGAVDEQERKP